METDLSTPGKGSYTRGGYSNKWLRVRTVGADARVTGLRAAGSINLTDLTMPRKAEKSEVLSALCQAASQPAQQAGKDSMPEAEAEEAGICTDTGRWVGVGIGLLHPQGKAGWGGVSASLIPKGTRGDRPLERAGPLPGRGCSFQAVGGEECCDSCNWGPTDGQAEGARKELCDIYL